MAKTCPSCGYSPIGPYIDNCPLCAEPVRHVYSDGAGGGSGGSGAAEPMSMPPLLIGGWVAIGVALAFLIWGDWPWLLLSLGLCGAAWWAIARSDVLLLRLLGASLLILFIPGVWLAAQPDILPGLDRRDISPERIMTDMMAVLQGTSAETLRMRARMKTISGAIFAVHAVAIAPLALLAPPLLNADQRRKLGGPIYLSKPQAIGGLAAWLILLPLLGWLAWPTVESWSDAPNQLNWPHAQWPGHMLPKGDDDEK